MPLRQPAAVAFSPDGKHLYATDSGANTITAFAIERNGDLTAIQTQPSGGVQPAFQAITPLYRV